jgi:glycerol-3-phosphate dehydrogenase
MAISDYVAIDPLALVLPSAVYVKLVEKFHPHVAKVAEIVEAAKGMTPEERAFVASRAQVMAAQASAVAEAMKAAK